ncbi:uncharacterized protein LOC114251559 [Bombyx mandarina]|uniref:Uncharacterized protein LOC114251559 n=1 Tax=Bombyx mandarina TaxID=7092 RepID=A0A6J2KI04_BOMMA|nr:uncharacterized protein LOC114251559 [Bombyx mandarina]
MSIKIEAETKVDSVPYVLAWDEKLFVGTESGHIYSYSADLSSNTSWPAHSVQLFALAAGEGNIYSSSNDGCIRVWNSDGEKIKEFPLNGGDVGVLRVFGKQVFAGDEIGNIVVYENGVEKAKYNVLEEVKDLWFDAPYLFTVRDLDVTVTEIKPDESKTRFITRRTMEGRAPLRVVGSKLLVVARGGNSLRLHDSSFDTGFKLLHEIKVSDMIVTSIAVTGDYVWTAGWDGFVRRWKIVSDKLEAAGEVNLGACVNSLSSNLNNVYAAIADGKIVLMNA